MSLLYINWNPSPEIFSIGPITVRWYGLLFAMGFFVGYFIMQRIFKKEQIPQSVLDKLTTYMFAATVIGARLGHCLFYDPAYYLSNPIEIIKIWEGGLASHGAGVGIIIALLILARKTSMPVLWYLDRIVIVTALAGMFIRTGNLINSEIIGKATELSWGFYFRRSHDPAISQIARHPAQIYEALSYLLIFGILMIYYNKRYPKFRDGQLFAMFLILVFGARFFIEYVKEVQVQFEEGLQLNMGQILSIPFVTLGIVLLIYINRKHKKEVV
jgi:prolipoprotein diacylglyceryl transferase